jgi:hypothetical protein
MADDTNSQSILARMTNGYAKREEIRIGQVVNDVLDAGRRAMDRARMFIEGAPASEKRAYKVMTASAQEEKREWRKMSPEQIRDRLQSTTAAVAAPRSEATHISAAVTRNPNLERLYKQVHTAYMGVRLSYSSTSDNEAEDIRRLETITSVRNEVARALRTDGVVNTDAISSADAKLGREWTERLSDAGVTLVERREQAQPAVITTYRIDYREFTHDDYATPEDLAAGRKWDASLKAAFPEGRFDRGLTGDFVVTGPDAENRVDAWLKENPVPDTGQRWGAPDRGAVPTEAPLVERSTRPTLQPGGWPDMDDVRKARAEGRPMELAGEDKLSAGVRAYINSGAPKQETRASFWKSEKREAGVPVQAQQRRMSV